MTEEALRERFKSVGEGVTSLTSRVERGLRVTENKHAENSSVQIRR